MIVEKEMPRKVQLAAKEGFDRLQRYRRARAMFIREFVGQYYANSKGVTGDAPINLIFHTIRTLVPNLVMKNPITRVSTEIVAQKEYAWLLGLGLDEINKITNFKDTLRAGIVSALFAFAIFKTGIANSGQIITYGDINIDPGQIYTDLVDLDDFTIDSSCRKLQKSAFMGDRNRVPRQLLLDDPDVDHDAVMRLPTSFHPDAKNKIEQLTQSNLSNSEIRELQDFVDIVELYVPDADALLMIPDPETMMTDDYLKAVPFYGVKEGPYTFLSFTPPVPNNPYPISEVSMWYDLHIMANKLMVKSMEQADRQKDVTIYDPSGAEEAEDIRTSSDGDTIAGNPDSVKVVSFGGQNVNNEHMLSQVQIWHNYISGNPDQMAGLKSDARTATQAQILEVNSSVIVEDEREMIYQCGAEIKRKEAWYLHTDPLIELPISRRRPGGGYVQLWLTPEQRRGDFLDFNFTLKARSMSRLDPTLKNKRIMEFGTTIIPALATSTQVLTQVGVPFNIRKCITDLADHMDLTDEVQEWFEDPEFDQRVALMQQLGPKSAGKAKIRGVMQNQGSPIGPSISSPGEDRNASFQEGAPQPAGELQ